MVVDSLKAAGNKAFGEGRYSDAVTIFSQAIEEEPSNHVLYSNRSAAHASLKNFDEALTDALKTQELAAEWPKSYSRVAAAYHGLGRLSEALEAAKKGLELEPTNAQLLKTQDELESAIFATGNSGASGNPDPMDTFGAILKDPGIWTKLANNPKTRAFLSDDAFCQKMTAAIANPMMAFQFMNGDSNFMTALLTLMGASFGMGGENGGADDIGSDDENSASSKIAGQDGCGTSCNDSGCTRENSSQKSEQTTRAENEAAKKATREAAAAADNELLRVRTEGNNAYRKRNFDAAMENYQRAFELSEEKDASILNNMAAVHFERREFEKCVEVSQRAIDVARTNGGSFEIVARAYARMGRAQEEGLEDFDAAILSYKTSLTERRTPDVINRLAAAQKEHERRRKAAYHSVELSDAARERGNAHFSACRYEEAAPEYSEAIKRNEKDPRAYANRSACYFKLGAFPEALRDADKCIELDPSYIKGYVRKANVLLIKKDYAAAVEVCENAEKINDAAIAEATKAADAATAEKPEGDVAAPASPTAQSLTLLHKQRDEVAGLLQRCFVAIQTQNDKLHSSGTDSATRQEALANAMKNPEIQAIMTDPVMRNILDQMSSDPAAAQAHMANPEIASKIRKLVAAGIVGTR